MQITQETLKRLSDARKRLRPGETVSLKDGVITIEAEAQNRADVRRIRSIRRKYEGPI